MVSQKAPFFDVFLAIVSTSFFRLMVYNHLLILFNSVQVTKIQVCSVKQYSQNMYVYAV